MKNIFALIITGFFLLTSCKNKQAEEQSSIPDEEKVFPEVAIDNAASQLKRLVKIAEEKQQNLRSTDSLGNIRWISEKYDWTEGFFPGSLWLTYKLTKENLFKEKAEKFQELYKSHKDQKNDHDLGFIFNCSYGNGYKLTKKEEYKAVVIDAANSLMKSYDSKVGVIMSWDSSLKWVQNFGWKYPVIIDNMMNLELLFEATKFTKDSTYYKAAISHANNTMKNHFRADKSSYHVVDYDPNKLGVVVKKQTNQGYADESAWARGQSWGLYGFTMCYRYTKDEKYLEHAKGIANFILNHPNLPKNKVPYWDYNAPNIPNAKRDASAGAILASALLELNNYVEGDNYKNNAKTILNSLYTSYSNNSDNASSFILNSSVGNMPIKGEVSVGINYADYYYLEGLDRLLNK